MAWSVILLMMISPVVAASGTEFTNNLFTDLGPLIALFGEQVSKQFLSRSLGLADSLLFAMAPLGIITGVVSAIRLSGYTWLRAIVGRATETRGAAGLELTSATSSDICELWDGKSVVRILGTPTILTVVYIQSDGDDLQQNDGPGQESERGALIENDFLDDGIEQSDDRVVDFEDAKERSWFTARESYAVRRSKVGRLQGAVWDQSDDAMPPRSQSAQDRPPPIPPIPPNISLNIRRRPLRRLVRLAAMIAALLQTFVLVFAGTITFTKSVNIDKAPSGNAFALLVTGTVLVCLGLFLCASTLNESSKKEYWKAKLSRQSRPVIQLIWLQKQQTVNEQFFPSFAIRPNVPELLISYAKEDFAHVRHQRVLFGVSPVLRGSLSSLSGSEARIGLYRLRNWWLWHAIPLSVCSFSCHFQIRMVVRS
jgi:hypothetical protein